MYLKAVQESYRLCNWVIEKQFSEVDNVFDIDAYVMKIVSFIIVYHAV